MATGMDTDAAIKDMLKPQQLKIDTIKQQQQLVSWQQELYRDVIKDIHSMQSKYFDVLNKDTYLLSSSNLNGMKYASSNPSINITANSDAKEGTYNINVTQMAEGAKITGIANKDKNGNEINLDTKLGDVNGFTDPTTFNISVNGVAKEVTVNKDMTVRELSRKISETTDGKVDLEYSSISKKFTLVTKDTGSEVNLGLDSNGVSLMGNLGLDTSALTGGTNIESIESTKKLGLSDQTLKVEYNDGTETKVVEIAVNADTTLDSLATDISKQTNGKVTLQSEIVSGKVELSLEGGTETTGNFTNIQNAASGFVHTVSVNEIKGTDLTAKIKLPGDATEYDITSKTNEFSKDGINFDVNGTGESILTVENDSEESVKLIKSFIEDYNKLIDKVNKLNTEKRNYNYKPLTEEQKKEMSEDEIKKWETQAKKGILKGDSYLNNMMSELRTSMFGDKDTLFSIGITTSSNVQDGGKLVFNEDKFKKALANNPEKTMETFKNGMEKVDKTFDKYASSTTIGGTGKRGLLIEKAGIEGSITDRNNILSKKILEQEDMIKVQTRKMSDMENTYYLQFAQLEKTMNSLNSQMNWFMQQMGG